MRQPPDTVERRPPGKESGALDGHGGGNVSAAKLAPAADGCRSWREMYEQERAKAATATAERRALVLRHPDLARRLTGPPLDYGGPDQWNGYVPPMMWREKLNDSPRRTALIAIYAEAMRRKNGGG